MARRTSFRAAGEQSGEPRFVAYYRVSTAQQGSSGLGLEAQRAAVDLYVKSRCGHILDVFEEVESGKRNDRPEIAAALAACRLRHAVLIIAKLDRLARNVAFISRLMESGVEFVACDNPHATKFTIHILAAVAELEREQISARTTAALQAAKARGIRLGNPNLKPGDRLAAKAARQVRTERSHAHASDVLPYIEAARRAGCESLGDLARALMARGIETPGGGPTWTATTVRRVIAKATA